MPDLPWWTIISTTELLDLRRRLAKHVRATFGNTLGVESEDVVQHAFVVLFQRRERVKPERDGLYRYLQTVARNAALDRMKTTRVRRKHHSEVVSKDRDRAPSGIAFAEPPLAGPVEENEKIWRVFCALNDLDRLVLWSHVVERQSIRAIARDLDLNWHRVAGIIEGALRRIRREFTS